MPRLNTVITGSLLLSAANAQPAAEQVDFFEKKVRPVLVNRCYACHSADTKPAGGLRVDDRNGLLTGGDSGPAIIPGEPEKSLLLDRIRHQNPKRRMPKEGDPVTDAELADLKAWIKDGVAWPAEKLPATFGRSGPSYDRIKAHHWSLQWVKDTKAPVVRNRVWPAGEIDRFILARLEEKNLVPVRDADPVTLIRRVTYDLTGLPPAPEEVDAFLNDKSPGAYTRLVDRLLQSPRFGERWGRHWLDVARYGESSGPSRNIPYPHAWRYRDYVLDSFNRDVPFDRFLQEQVAGDLLPASSIAERDRLLIATGFLALGPKDVNQRFKERFLMDNVDEKIDTVTRSTLALTVSCARCHDHKFDPIPVTDYYAMAGIFTSTEDAAGVISKMGGSGLDYYDPKLLVRLASYVPAASSEKVAELEAEVAAAKKAWEEIRGTPAGLALGPNGKPKQQPYRLKLERLQSDLLNLTDPAAHGFAVHGVREGKHISDTAVRIRGQAERLGPIVPRGFLTAFAVPGAPSMNSAQSGRLELAQWLTHPKNPLAPRVIVNRVWQYLFGQGIVTTVDNFGITGDRPSHPELLDYLATQFIRDGWSMKKLVRKLVLSRAYRLGSEFPERYRDIDPANRLVWRHAPRALEAEEIRDAMLASAGRLELTPPTGSPARDLRMMEMPDNGPESRRINEQADHAQYRSVYLPLLRGVTPKSLEAFDPVTQTLVTGRRDATTVPAQALYLLNSAIVRQQSLALARRLISGQEPGDTARIRRAYQLTLSRTPTKLETVRASTFLETYEASYAKAVSVQPVFAKASLPALPVERVDQVDQTDAERNAPPAAEEVEPPKNPKEAAWMSFVQALYASAEFRFVR